jgi:hypothetical protein
VNVTKVAKFDCGAMINQQTTTSYPLIVPELQQTGHIADVAGTALMTQSRSS